MRSENNITDRTALHQDDNVLPQRGFGVRFLRGRAADPAWARPGLWMLLALSAVLYLWDLSASGWANAFYSAAAQAGSASWKAFFFGSSDAANFITVDKTPGAVWLMTLSARVFGVSSWSILLPEALLGVASVGLLFSTVRRVAGPAAGLVAGLVLALTPVAALMFRFNNPDALMVCALVAAAWAITRAIGDGRTKWLLWCGVFVGVAFLAKMMQAFLVLPGFGVAYLVAGPPQLWARVRQLTGALAAMLVTGGWWLLVVWLWPAADRPFIGGSQSNSVWDLLFGYNGFGRLTGDEVGSVGWSDQSSATKLIDTEIGGQISWLLPAAMIGLVAVLVLRGRRPRTDAVRASMLVWGGWLVVTGVTFSAMQGIIHPYYSVALAPAVGALVGIGGRELWSRRRHPAAVATLAGTVVVSGLWARTLLDRTPDFVPWLAPTIVAISLAAAVVVVIAALARSGISRVAVPTAAVLGLLSLLAAPSAYAVDTVLTPHTGAIPSAGPTAAGAGFGGGRGGFTGGGFPGGGGRGGPGGGGFAGPGGFPGGQNGLPARGFGGGGGGLLDAPTPSAELVTTLQSSSSHYTWAAAVVGSNNAAGYQLATDLPVMAVGGFNGTDPAPTLDQFRALVAAGRIHYFIGGTIGFGGRGGASSGSQDANLINQWVSDNFPPTTVGSTTLYDLTPAGHS